MDNKNYKVVILKTPSYTSDTVKKLSGLFKISSDKAEDILSRYEYVVKKQTDRKTAEKFHKAISSIGVNCRIDEIIIDEEINLPTIEEIKPPEPSEIKPLTDLSRREQDIQPPQNEQVDLSLESRPVEKSRDNTGEDKLIDDVTPEKFCPQCGTIRASADSICVHCGYDPVAINKTSKKKTLMLSGIAIISVILVIAIAYPFYLEFSKRMQIETDLKLAFDSRNEVTAFIEKTNFWPNQNIDAGLAKQIGNASLKSVEVGENAVITATIRGEVLDGEDQTLIFTPNTLKGRIVWNCLKGTLAEKYRPEICIKKPAAD